VIVFRKLTFANFLSVGNTPVTIDFTDKKTTLVHGMNGSGKSTILDALTYVLFNKPFRRVNLPQLINTQNKRSLLTEIEFTIGKNDYIVQRGIKPKRFKVFKNGEEIDAKAADKDNQSHLEQNILGLTYKSFTQVVILGSSNFIPFMQLSTAGRRECVEDFLDIKVFSTMAVIAKERLRSLKDQANTLSGDISNLEYKKDIQLDRIKELEDQSQGEETELKDKLRGLENSISSDQKAVEELREKELDLIEEVHRYQTRSPLARMDEFKRVFTALTIKRDDSDKRLAFFRDNDECHHCGQAIEGETKDKQIQTSQSEGDKFRKGLQECKEHLERHQRDIDSCEVVQQKIQKIQREIFQHQTLIETYLNTQRDTQKRLDALQNNTSILDRETGKLEVLEEELKGLETRKDNLITTLFEHEMVVNLLKDSGIKTQVVKKYLPVMNKCIRKYLSELDLPIHFILDEEFNESVSSPLHQDFSYASFSEGQKGRIDLALMFTWREVGRLKNSVSTNLLILDEVFSSSLDDTGKENLLRILRYKLDDNQRIIVVDHTLSQEFKDKFDRSIEVNRIGGFSRYS
jgi:DNA repair exonuclease SbcCD ATPase subunit